MLQFLREINKAIREAQRGPRNGNGNSNGNSNGNGENGDNGTGGNNGDNGKVDNGNSDALAKRCERIATQYDREIVRVNNQSDNMTRNVEKRRDNILARLDRMDERGVDTTEPRNKLSELDSVLESINSAHAQLASEIGTEKEKGCTDPTEFQSTLKELRKNRQELNKMRRDVNMLLRDVNKAIAVARKAANGNGNGNSSANGNGR